MSMSVSVSGFRYGNGNGGSSYGGSGGGNRGTSGNGGGSGYGCNHSGYPRNISLGGHINNQHASFCPDKRTQISGGDLRNMTGHENRSVDVSGKVHMEYNQDRDQKWEWTPYKFEHKAWDSTQTMHFKIHFNEAINIMYDNTSGFVSPGKGLRSDFPQYYLIDRIHNNTREEFREYAKQFQDPNSGMEPDD